MKWAADPGRRPKIDGRKLRRERTRAKLLAAARELMVGNDLRPTALSIVAAAGCSMHTIWQHFDDLHALHLACLSTDQCAALASALRRLDDAALIEAVVRGRLPS